VKEIIEDTISRDKKFQEERRRRVEHLRAIGAPDIMIETEEMISRMTVAEYKAYCQRVREDEEKEKSAYASKNPIRKSIVDEIYYRESKLECDYHTYMSDTLFMMAIDPLDFMSKEDYDKDLYKAFLDHIKEIYADRCTEKFRENK